MPRVVRGLTLKTKHNHEIYGYGMWVYNTKYQFIQYLSLYWQTIHNQDYVLLHIQIYIWLWHTQILHVRKAHAISGSGSYNTIDLCRT